MAARIARSEILYDGCCAHVISRSVRKIRIFRDDEDYVQFLDLLRQTKKEYAYQIYHYCLMDTHFHLVVGISESCRFSRAIQKLKSQYIYHFHSKYEKSGPIWRERYRSLLIENDSYLYACGQYIENNPVRAGIVNKAQDWPYSSSRYYLLEGDDALVGGYATGCLPQLPHEVEINDEGEFENGIGISSSYFRFQLAEKRRSL